MPIYEYVCPDCKVKFERMRPLSQATEPAPCPKCQGNAERVFSTFACFSADGSGVSSDESGMSSALGGSSCASCGLTNCSTCAM